ncbi:ubiquitin-conjugating enzyme (huntingtin interacting protein 2) [Sphaeroforma arctica JP610]|uniref:Ubiquitin-conjugating enzyme (Huntingtin interacting protein 2) n=1 Tax=Sphaeroforma arctica JP610 TaxID=667725 RepID=A0A0L0FU61_9EUKA|nr:ubiquitin-conjugating enzyme (huntingtin interacting protein 2) [Sphaeroforma arctica JP610]KNC80076.1 ubiquitin-conjugating enzyme (huntingtin interacting protein 2) [Sphaeroforma arctica JP610]|eukprot:XP_014153978.1 ubiquitin-conjugating enzyme (huntingtin interacting protein 2) [Sphaeroforma arctica JP610]
MVNNNMDQLRGFIKGPKDTPYSEGTFELGITIPPMYPFVPPKVKFETKVWHPNVSSQTGAICLDILKDQWAAAMTIKSVLFSIQLLLASPEPNSPQDAVVAKQYMDHFDEWKDQAKQWTEKYAQETETKFERNIKQLMEMGFSREKCEKYLNKTNGNIEEAAAKLLK